MHQAAMQMAKPGQLAGLRALTSLRRRTTARKCWGQMRGLASLALMFDFSTESDLRAEGEKAEEQGTSTEFQQAPAVRARAKQRAQFWTQPSATTGGSTILYAGTAAHGRPS